MVPSEPTPNRGPRKAAAGAFPLSAHGGGTAARTADVGCVDSAGLAGRKGGLAVTNTNGPGATGGGTVPVTVPTSFRTMSFSCARCDVNTLSATADIALSISGSIRSYAMSSRSSRSVNRTAKVCATDPRAAESIGYFVVNAVAVLLMLRYR